MVKRVLMEVACFDLNCCTWKRQILKFWVAFFVMSWRCQICKTVYGPHEWCWVNVPVHCFPVAVPRMWCAPANTFGIVGRWETRQRFPPFSLYYWLLLVGCGSAHQRQDSAGHDFAILEKYIFMPAWLVQPAIQTQLWILEGLFSTNKKKSHIFMQTVHLTSPENICAWMMITKNH